MPFPWCCLCGQKSSIDFPGEGRHTSTNPSFPGSDTPPETRLKERNSELTQKIDSLNQSVKQLRNQLSAAERSRLDLQQKIQDKDRELRRLQGILESIRPNKPSEISKPSSISGKLRRAPVVGTNDENRTDTKKTPKTPEQRKFLREAIENNGFLKHLSGNQINEMVEYAQRTIPSNDVFIKEGMNGDRMYILESGELEVTQVKLYNVNEGSTFLRNIQPPAVFGEIAILYNSKRTATVTAKTPTRVWMIERGVYQNIMRTTANSRRAELMQALKKVPLMEDFGNGKLAKLTEVLEEETFRKGEYIIRQGEYGEIFYIIMEGEVDVTERGEDKNVETFIRTLGRGFYFGEKALRSEGGKRGANVIAKSAVRCVTLDKKPFLSLIGTLADKDYDAINDKPVTPRPEGVMRLQVASGPVARKAAPRRSFDPLAEARKLRNQSNAAIVMPQRRMRPSFENVALVDFDLIGVLGIGGFGRVELVCMKQDPSRSFALKCMKKTHIVETKQEEHIYSEKRIMRDADCPFIVQLYRTFKNDKYVYMLMEPCLGGEVWAKLRDDGYFDEARTRFYTACVVEAVEYLHLRGIVYRDLKPENLLLDAKGFVKIVDFGFAKSIQHGEKTWTFCGTPEYVAPEVILNKGHDVAVDYWALGILIFEMLTGNPPFNSSDAMKTYRLALRGIDAIEWPQKVSKSAQNLIRRLCRENPAERIGNLREGVIDIKNHRWFSGFDWPALRSGTYTAPYVPEITSSTDLRNFDRFEKDDEIVEKEMSGWDKDF